MIRPARIVRTRRPTPSQLRDRRATALGFVALGLVGGAFLTWAGAAMAFDPGNADVAPGYLRACVGLVWSHAAAGYLVAILGGLTWART